MDSDLHKMADENDAIRYEAIRSSHQMATNDATRYQAIRCMDDHSKANMRSVFCAN